MSAWSRKQQSRNMCVISRIRPLDGDDGQGGWAGVVHVALPVYLLSLLIAVCIATPGLPAESTVHSACSAAGWKEWTDGSADTFLFLYIDVLYRVFVYAWDCACILCADI
jgi:hypothetical protein